MPGGHIDLIDTNSISSKGPFTLNVKVNVCASVCIKHCVYGDVDIDTENGYRTYSFHLHFVTIVSIIFENANADIDAKCESAFIYMFFNTLISAYIINL